MSLLGHQLHRLFARRALGDRKGTRERLQLVATRHAATLQRVVVTLHAVYSSKRPLKATSHALRGPSETQPQQPNRNA